MNIYLLRHCQSLFNENEENDVVNCSLTCKGVEQAKNLHFHSFPKHYPLIICSPLHRSIQTFFHSNLTFDHFQINDLFREIYLGCHSDLLYEHESIPIENDVLLRQRIEKIDEFLAKIKQLNCSDILIITHADLIWHSTSREINQETFGTWTDNGEIIFWKQI